MVKTPNDKTNESTTDDSISTSKLPQTSENNYKDFMVYRDSLLGKHDDLTEEEISDIQEYRSNSKDTKQFSNVGDFIKDLND